CTVLTSHTLVDFPPRRVTTARLHCSSEELCAAADVPKQVPNPMTRKPTITNLVPKAFIVLLLFVLLNSNSFRTAWRLTIFLRYLHTRKLVRACTEGKLRTLCRSSIKPLIKGTLTRSTFYAIEILLGYDRTLLAT